MNETSQSEIATSHLQLVQRLLNIRALVSFPAAEENEILCLSLRNVCVFFLAVLLRAVYDLFFHCFQVSELRMCGRPPLVCSSMNLSRWLVEWAAAELKLKPI